MTWKIRNYAVSLNHSRETFCIFKKISITIFRRLHFNSVATVLCIFVWNFYLLEDCVEFVLLFSFWCTRWYGLTLKCLRFSCFKCFDIFNTWLNFSTRISVGSLWRQLQTLVGKQIIEVCGRWYWRNLSIPQVRSVHPLANFWKTKYHDWVPVI